MFVRETKTEILSIVKTQLDEVKALKEELAAKEDFELADMNYGYEGDKKTILKPAQGNSAKLAIAAQTCLFQLVQQIDVFKEQVMATQKKKDPPVKDVLAVCGNFLASTRSIRVRDEFKELFGVKN